MGNARLMEGSSGNGIFLSGHDDWVEFYRDKSLDVDENALAIEFLGQAF
jgi:beta-galactosidase